MDNGITLPAAGVGTIGKGDIVFGVSKWYIYNELSKLK
jgi:hypothetical protein